MVLLVLLGTILMVAVSGGDEDSGEGPSHPSLGEGIHSLPLKSSSLSHEDATGRGFTPRELQSSGLHLEPGKSKQ